MKLVCPGCSKSVEVPESALGTDYPCLVCGTKIPVPKTYTPSVTVPTPPAPAPTTSTVSKPTVPPPPPGLAPATAPASAPPALPGDVKECGISLSPKFLDWLAPAALALALVLTFFTWVGAYPGGHRLFAQNAWDAMSRNITPNTIGQDEMDKLEKNLETVLVYSKWLWLYTPLLIVTLILAFAERFVKDLTPTTVPGAFAWVLPFWPMRFRLLTILCCVLLGLFLWQSWLGFGLENAVRDHVAKQFLDQVKSADTQAKRDVVTLNSGLEAARYAVQTTTWYRLAMLAHIAAVLGMLGRTWLSKREGKPTPRFLVRY